jgi:hypothetical protein
MASDQNSRTELIEQRAIERDLIAQLSPSKEKQAQAKARAERLRDLLERVKARNAAEQD